MDQKNLILAIALSIVILLGFQYFLDPYLAPEQEVAQQPIADDADDLAGLPTTRPTRQDIDDAFDDLLAGATVDSRAEALAEMPRIRIDTDRLHGSLSLIGARLDDLTLADYHEEPDPSTPEIVLLRPREGASAYFADFGWIDEDRSVNVPRADTLWHSDDTVLTPNAPVTLSWDNGEGLLFERVIEVDEDYLFTVTQRVTNQGGDAVLLAPFGRVQRFGTPDTLGFFILHEGPYGVFDGALQEYSYRNLRDDRRIEHSSEGGWLGFTDKYWMVGLIPNQQATVNTSFLHQLDGGVDRYYATYQNAYQHIAPGSIAEETVLLFAGAKEVTVIDGYAERYGIDRFDRAIDFGWLYFLTKPIFYILLWLNGLVGNFGVAILLLTVMIKLVFFPLANKSYKAMSKMKALQPEMMSLKERFGNDRMRMGQEMAALYKREKVSPASGCLPILVQIPVFFALYKVLFVTIEMRHAPFFGWIQDLSAPDPTSFINLFGLLPFAVPSMLQIGVWPILMGLTMFLQQKLNPAPTDPIQQKVFMFLPVIFTVLLAGFPAGLVIYWAWNNFLSILQQYVIMRRMGVKIGGGMEPATVTASASGAAKEAAGANGTGDKGKKRKAKEAEAGAPAEGDTAETGAGDEGAAADETPASAAARRRPAAARKRGNPAAKRKR